MHAGIRPYTLGDLDEPLARTLERDPATLVDAVEAVDAGR